MKILQTIVSFYPMIRGSINQVYLIASELEKRRITAPVITTYQGAANSPSFESIKGIEVHRYKSQLRLFSYDVTLGMMRSFYDCNLIHAHEFRSFQSDYGWIMSRLYQKPFIMNTHGTLLAYKNVVSGIMPKLPYIFYDAIAMKNSVKRADKVIVSSKIEYDEAMAFGIAKDKLSYIPYAIDSKKYLRQAKNKMHGIRENPDQLVLLFTGRIARCRSLELIVEAVKMIDNAVLVIIGDENLCAGTEKKGYVNELRQMVLNLSLDGKVKFIGWKQDDELIDYFLSADIFIYPSIHESFGLPILEAAAAGLPIIATRAGIAPEIIQDGKTGYLVGSDARQIAACIRQLSDSDRRKEIGQTLQKIIAEKYDVANVIEYYLALYEEFN